MIIFNSSLECSNIVSGNTTGLLQRVLAVWGQRVEVVRKGVLGQCWTGGLDPSYAMVSSLWQCRFSLPTGGALLVELLAQPGLLSIQTTLKQAGPDSDHSDGTQYKHQPVMSTF